ncbi:hypothetical protein TWF730_003921 [Orbilia blumenaviensis]|uniref:CBM1 domain-containing protein n=1 Tax=Orbilia blumenaviensis TaxID=1796055 RepID=A0AAV9U3I6_9PEZI
MVSVKAIAVAVVVPAVYAQTQVLWGQCAGVAYQGPTICGSGATCTVYNPYYGQCIPGSPPTTTPPPTKTTTITSCPSSTITCSSATLPMACGTGLYTTTYCSAFCATATPPRITVPASDLVKRCIPSPTTTPCRTTTSTCTTLTVTMPCNTSTYTVEVCSPYCATATPPASINIPSSLKLGKRCSPTTSRPQPVVVVTTAA